MVAKPYTEAVSERARWTDVAPPTSIEVFADFYHVSVDHLRDYELAALVLPNNRALPERPTETHLFAPHAKEVVDAFQRGGVHAALYRDDRDRREVFLKSADVVLPILKFVGESTAAVALGILSAWLYDRFIKSDQKSGTVKFEYAILDEDQVIAWRRIEGNLQDVRPLIAAESERLRRRVPPHQPTQLSVQPPRQPVVSRHVSAARDKLDAANALLKKAGTAYRSKTVEGRRVAETHMREGLALIRQALLLNPNDKTRRYLHRVGLRTHSIFQCIMEYSEGGYWVSCPVLLSHGKGGFSIGGSGRSICSICGQAALECDHVKGRLYDSVRAWRYEDVCNICSMKECRHVEGAAYDNVEAFAIVTELHLDHVAFVMNPANPLAVVERYSIPRSEVLEELPESEHGSFVYGETVLYCHHCTICTGVR